MLLIMFELKKILGGLLMPLPLLGLVSLILLIFALKQRKVAIALSLMSLVTLLLASTPLVANLLIKNSQPTSFAFNYLKHPNIDKIVVLGCDINPNPALSANSQLGNCALTRLVEGIRLANIYPHAQLIVSGGGYEKSPTAR